MRPSKHDNWFVDRDQGRADARSWRRIAFEQCWLGALDLQEGGRRKGGNTSSLIRAGHLIGRLTRPTFRESERRRCKAFAVVSCCALAVWLDWRRNLGGGKVFRRGRVVDKGATTRSSSHYMPTQLLCQWAKRAGFWLCLRSCTAGVVSRGPPTREARFKTRVSMPCMPCPVQRPCLVLSVTTSTKHSGMGCWKSFFLSTVGAVSHLSCRKDMYVPPWLAGTLSLASRRKRIVIVVCGCCFS